METLANYSTILFSNGLRTYIQLVNDFDTSFDEFPVLLLQLQICRVPSIKVSKLTRFKTSFQ